MHWISYTTKGLCFVPPRKFCFETTEIMDHVIDHSRGKNRTEKSMAKAKPRTENSEFYEYSWSRLLPSLTRRQMSWCNVFFSKQKQPLSWSQCFDPENAMEAKKMMVHLVLCTDAIVVQRPHQKIHQLPVDPNFEPKDLAPVNIEYFFKKSSP